MACAFAPCTSLLPKSASRPLSATPCTVSMRMPWCRRGPRIRDVGGFGGRGGFGVGKGGGGGQRGGNSAGNGRGGPARRSGTGAGGAGSSGNPFVALWNGYNASLETYPILTKALTSLVGFFLGDLIAQRFIGGATVLDRARLARMASFGFLFHGPTGHYFYGFLDSLIVGKSPLKIATKVAIDQLLWAPIFTACFFVYLGLAESKSKQQIIDKVKNDTWAGVTASWKFWPIAHVINFSLIPTSQRLLYINTLQVGYNVILSMIGNK